MKRQTYRHTEKELGLSKLHSWTEKSQDPGTSEYYYIQLNGGGVNGYRSAGRIYGMQLE